MLTKSRLGGVLLQNEIRAEWEGPTQGCQIGSDFAAAKGARLGGEI